MGYDGTDSGRRALAAAADLAGYGSMVSVAALASGYGAAGEPAALLREAREQLLRRLVVARYLDRTGDPVEVLVESARALRVDLVVVGRGSQRVVSGAVGDCASCDVLIVAC
ncbi:MAG: universal stress protein [Acidimicrobiia bacterium]